MFLLLIGGRCSPQNCQPGSNRGKVQISINVKHIQLLEASSTPPPPQPLMEALSFSWPLMGILGVSEALVSDPVLIHDVMASDPR